MKSSNAPASPNFSVSSVEQERRAHEPSMEEILASIRKIIADEETSPSRAPLGERARIESVAAPAARAPVMAPVDAPSLAEEPAADPLVARRLEEQRVAQERAAQERAAQERAAQERAAQERAAQERAAQERAVAERLEAERIQAERREAERLEAERLEAERLQAEHVQAEHDQAERRHAQAIEADAELEDASDAADDVAADGAQDGPGELPTAALHSHLDRAIVDGREPAAWDRSVSAAAPRAAAVETTQDEAPILSPVANATIASAFQALSATVTMTSPEVIERHVRDLLRPMLKQWLDDNLPVMVERLVRTEIERVARGGR